MDGLQLFLIVAILAVNALNIHYLRRIARANQRIKIASERMASIATENWHERQIAKDRAAADAILSDILATTPRRPEA